MRKANDMHGVIVVLNRRGRKRKSGRRHPNGDLAAPKVNYALLTALQPHRRDLPPQHRLSEKAGTPLGNLNLRGIISDDQHEAGRLYAIDCGAYFATIGVPIGLGGGGKGFDCPATRQCENCECRRRKDRYDGAFLAVFSAGQEAARAVSRVAVHGENFGNISDLIRGLDALVKYYGLTTGWSHGNSRNTQ